jgi:hypothetical protein
MHKKSAPETIPWLIIRKMLPRILCVTDEKIPIVTTPIWPTEEYAIIFLRSTCWIVVIEAYTIPKILITKINGVKNAEDSGKRPVEYRKNPNPPNFNKIPAKITEPEVGASQ